MERERESHTQPFVLKEASSADQGQGLGVGDLVGSAIPLDRDSGVVLDGVAGLHAAVAVPQRQLGAVEAVGLRVKRPVRNLDTAAESAGQSQTGTGDQVINAASLTSSNFLALYCSAPFRKLSRMISHNTVPCKTDKAQFLSLSTSGRTE